MEVCVAGKILEGIKNGSGDHSLRRVASISP
jgi:hypothetical protein